MDSERSERPSATPLVIRIGVTGHRLESLQAAGYDEVSLRAAIRDVLLRIKEEAEKILAENREAYAGKSSVLRVISPLAEGSDRFVAEEALALGYTLQSPLPFPPEEYAHDFKTAESKQTFADLLGKAKPVFTLDGSRSDADLAYETVGRVVLRQSDVLIAIWDGKGAKGQGGTGQIVRESLAQRTPTVWIRATKPHSVFLLERISEDGRAAVWKKLSDPVSQHEPEGEKAGFVSRLLKKLAFHKESQGHQPKEIFNARLREILALSSPKELEALDRFFKEPKRRYRLAVWHRLIWKIFVWSWSFPGFRVRHYEQRQEDEWKEWLARWSPLPQPNTVVGAEIGRSYRTAFDWSDLIADICADRYRSSFVATYLLGALAVLAAFLGSYHGKLPSIFTEILPDAHDWFKFELIFIASILLLVVFNKLYHWHERWIDYRLLAEGLRQMRVLAPFARVTPAFAVPAYLSEDDPAPAWFNWYFRALVRQAGLVEATVTGEYLKVCQDVLSSEITSQINYHQKNESRLEALHKRLHWLSIILFILTLFACLLHLSLWTEATFGEYAAGVLTLFAIVFPAFGAAIQGILHQGEFGRLAHRSRAIKNRLQQLAAQVNDPNRERSSRELARVTESFSEIQILEQADWRAVFINKEISLP